MAHMTWTAWNNGSHHASGAGYGLKVPIYDRDSHIHRSFRSISLEVPSKGEYRTIQFNIDKDSFWNDECRELISKEFGKWLREGAYAPWVKGEPPKFRISKIVNRTYRLLGLAAR